MHVFTYGSLMFDRVWRRVVGADNPKTDAYLCGFKRTRIKNEIFPALIPATGSDCVHGLVYMDVGDSELDMLDHFEGEYYQRRMISCRTIENKSLPAWVYVFRKLYANRVIDQPWDPIWFANVGIHQFLAEYNGFHLKPTGE